MSSSSFTPNLHGAVHRFNSCGRHVSIEEPWLDDERYDAFTTEVKLHDNGIGETALVRFADGSMRAWTRVSLEDAGERPWRELA